MGQSEQDTAWDGYLDAWARTIIEQIAEIRENERDGEITKHVHALVKEELTDAWAHRPGVGCPPEIVIFLAERAKLDAVPDLLVRADAVMKTTVQDPIIDELKNALQAMLIELENRKSDARVFQGQRDNLQTRLDKAKKFAEKIEVARQERSLRDEKQIRDATDEAERYRRAFHTLAVRDAPEEWQGSGIEGLLRSLVPGVGFETYLPIATALVNGGFRIVRGQKLASVESGGG